MTLVEERERRYQRRRESAMLHHARLELLAELDRLKDELCDNCRKPVSQAQYTCECSAALRIREIGQELSTLLNERAEVKNVPKEVRKVNAKNKTSEITEEAVSAMREEGMTYTAIAKHFGVSITTLTTHRQNWELERVRAQHQKEKSLEVKNVEQGTEVESSVPPSMVTVYEEKISKLEATLVEKEEFIRKQWNTIDKLTAEHDQLAKQKESSNSQQDEIKDERKLLAILLEREAERMKNLVEVDEENDAENGWKHAKN